MTHAKTPIRHSLVKALERVGSFDSLDESTLLRIVGVSANLFWRQGSIIFEPGDSSDGLYILLSGRVRIFEPDGEDVAEIGPGDFFGESSLLLDTEHTKSAEAVEDCELMVVPHEAFQVLLASDKRLEGQVLDKLRQRLPEGEEIRRTGGPATEGVSSEA